MKLRRVISGGQIGADIAGLRAARDCGLETGGWITRGFRTKVGSRPEYGKTYGLKETQSRQYPPRTAMNVREADATIRIAADFTTAGEKLTLRCCVYESCPYWDVIWNRDTGEFDTTPEELVWWLDALHVQTLNVAGNGIIELEEPAYTFLKRVFELAKHKEEKDGNYSP